MKRIILQTKVFENEVKSLIAERKIDIIDFDSFKKLLVENPKKGSVISSTGGVRKIRLKSSSKGKSGGFRICYIDIEEKLILFLLYIYPKNEKEDLTPNEKKELKQIAKEIKRKIINE